MAENIYNDEEMETPAGDGAAALPFPPRLLRGERARGPRRGRGRLGGVDAPGELAREDAARGVALVDADDERLEPGLPRATHRFAGSKT